MPKIKNNLWIEWGINSGVTTGSDTAYVLSIWNWGVLKDKTPFTVEFNVDSWVAPTLDINSTGAKSLYKTDGTAIDALEVLASGQYGLLYDLTNDRYIVTNPEVSGGSGTPTDLNPVWRTIIRNQGINYWYQGVQ